MSPGMVRTGGICAFLVLVVMIVGTFAVTAMVADSVNLRTGQVTGSTGGAKIVGIIVNLLILGLIVMTLWTSKGLFNGFRYRGGDVPVYLIIGAIIISFVLSFIGGASLTQLTSARMVAGVSNVMGIISFLVLLIMFVGFIWFSIACISFGGKAKMGLWKAIGILYLIVGACFSVAMLIMIIMVATKTINEGLAGFAGVMILIGALVWIAAIICHGIGLLIGAGRMQGQGA